MLFKSLNRLHIITFMLLVAINCWIYIHRDNGFAYTSFANQNQLYQSDETPYIQGFYLHTNESLEIIVNPNSTQNNWLVEKRSLINKKNEHHPIIKLQEGKHNYTLFNNSDSITLGFDYTKSQTYKQSNRTRESVVELCYSSIPINNNSIGTRSYWQQTSPYSNEQEINEVKKIVKDSLQIKTTDNNIQIIEKISAFILKHIGTDKGIPSDKMDSLSPFRQFNLAKTKQSKVWCGNFSDIFSFFAQCAGITTRLVCLEGKIGDISKSGHSFNEAYIKELQKWVFVDLTSNSLFAKSSSNQYLNSIEFYNLYKLSPKEITITRFINDSIKQENFEVIKPFYDDYFQSNNQFVFYNNTQFKNNLYSFSSKLKRYAFKNSTYSIYTEAKDHENEKFYIKQFALGILLSFTLYWILSMVILKFK